MIAPESRGVAATTLLATAVDAAGVLPIYLLGALAVQLQTAVGLDVENVGLLFAAYFGTAAALSVPVGRFTERVDPGVFLRSGIVLGAGALVGISTSGSVGSLFILVVVAGAATALTRTTSSLLVARSIPTGRQGLALGIRNCAIPGAALLAGLAVPTIALTVGWRMAFAIASGLAVGLLAATPRSVPRPRLVSPSAPAADMPMSQLFGMAIAAALASSAAVALAALTSVTAVEAGMEEGSAGLLIAAASLAGVASRIGVGWWTDRRAGSQLDVVVAMLLIGAGAFGLVAVGVAPLLWLAVPVAYATAWAFYGSYYLSVIRLNPVAQGTALGVAQSGAFAGSILGPPVLAALASRISFTAAWVAAAAATLTAAAIILAVESRSRRTIGGK